MTEDTTIKNKTMKVKEEIQPTGDGARSERQEPRRGRKWVLSSPMVNDMIAKRKTTGTLPLYGIDVPTVGDSDMTHYGGVVVFGNRERAEQIIREHNSYDALVKAIEAEAARRAYHAGLGVSEWKAFLWPEARAALVDTNTTQEVE